MGRRKALPPFTLITAAVPEEVAKSLRKIAGTRGVPVSALVREALERYVREEVVKMGMELLTLSTASPLDGGQPVLVDKVDLIKVDEFIDSLRRAHEMTRELSNQVQYVEKLLLKPLTPERDSFLRSWVSRYETLKKWLWSLRARYRQVKHLLPDKVPGTSAAPGDLIWEIYSFLSSQRINYVTANQKLNRRPK